MKKLLLLFAAFALISKGYSQSYTFSKSTASYQELSGDIVLSAGDWDDFDTSLMMPFLFVHFEDTVENYLISEDGVYFGPWRLGQVTAFGQQMQNRGSSMTSIVSIKTEGSTPNRILKIQYKNLGLFDSTSSYPENFVNHQIWFYETNYRIELRYGSSNFNSASVSEYNYRTGIMRADGSDGFYLYGNPASPSLENDPETELTLDSYPASGTVYTFNPFVVNGIEETSTYTRISVYPNPFSHQLWIDASADIKTIKVRDAGGKEIYSIDVEQMSTMLNTFEWSSGIYFIAVETVEGTVVHKLYK